MDEASQALRDRLIEVYETHVRARLTEQGIDAPDGIDAAIERGRMALESTLDELLSKPYGDQTRGPLELFQEAMEHPTLALHAAGVEPVRRDETTRSALPGDLYDLAPASSQTLGEKAWHAHLAWGLAKAMAVTSKGEKE